MPSQRSGPASNAQKHPRAPVSTSGALKKISVPIEIMLPSPSLPGASESYTLVPCAYHLSKHASAAECVRMIHCNDYLAQFADGPRRPYSVPIVEVPCAPKPLEEFDTASELARFLQERLAGRWAAVSYTWKQAARKEHRQNSFGVAGVGLGRSDSVSQDVLRAICHAASHRMGCEYVWIDQLCVKQDRDEKFLYVRRGVSLSLFRAAACCLVLPAGLGRLARLDGDGPDSEETNYVHRVGCMLDCVAADSQDVLVLHTMSRRLVGARGPLAAEGKWALPDSSREWRVLVVDQTRFRTEGADSTSTGLGSDAVLALSDIRAFLYGALYGLKLSHPAVTKELGDAKRYPRILGWAARPIHVRSRPLPFQLGAERTPNCEALFHDYITLLEQKRSTQDCGQYLATLEAPFPNAELDRIEMAIRQIQAWDAALMRCLAYVSDAGEKRLACAELSRLHSYHLRDGRTRWFELNALGFDFNVREEEPRGLAPGAERTIADATGETYTIQITADDPMPVALQGSPENGAEKNMVLVAEMDGSRWVAVHEPGERVESTEYVALHVGSWRSARGENMHEDVVESDHLMLLLGRVQEDDEERDGQWNVVSWMHLEDETHGLMRVTSDPELSGERRSRVTEGAMERWMARWWAGTERKHVFYIQYSIPMK
ncbi:hypothetical protein FKP32DRAFT_1688621 [Trametes sanguinea]|nr:hypothetical protein FKP32DRAFT_1688621 [Trametes sanguinea]